MPDLTVSVATGNTISVSVSGDSTTATVSSGGTATVTVAGTSSLVGAGKVIVSSGGLADLTSEQQAQITQGVVVVTTDGYRWVFSGVGSVTSQSNYVQLADITPEWGVISGKPSTFAPSAHKTSHATGGADAIAPSDIGAAAASHTHAIADTTGLQTALDGKAAAGHQHIYFNDIAAALSDAPESARANIEAAASDHVHGSITNDGKIGTASGQIVVTGTGGALTVAATISASSVSGLASVATSGSYNDLSNKPTIPSAYTLPTASATVLGGVKIGSGISIDGSGVISASAGYTLPAATGSTLGGVIVGTGLGVSSGTVSVSYGTTSGTACEGNDSRLSDTRTPTDGSVTDAKITSGGLSTSVLNWAAIQPWQANTAYAKGDLVSNAGIAYRRSVAGTSGATFNVANWQQTSPSEFVGSQITSGTVPVARLGAGSPSSSNYLRGDGTFAAAPVTSVDGNTGAVTVTKSAVYEFTRSSKPSDATGSTPGPYTWSVPSGAKLVEIFCIGGGGGGGSGRRGAASTNRWGGGGGSGANAMHVSIPASLITTSLTVTVGAGGGGGAAVTADDTDGNAGTAGSDTTISFNSGQYARGIKGSAGGAGTATAGGGGQPNNTDARTYSGVAGGASSVSGNGNGAFPNTGNAALGGAGGGGISNGNTAYNGGTVWNPAALAGFFAAGVGTVTAGNASTTAAGGAGADGATYGYGGSGGGASANGNNSGKGGNGGDGYVRITVWF